MLAYEKAVEEEESEDGGIGPAIGDAGDEFL
jgi:hypothetical protein